MSLAHHEVMGLLGIGDLHPGGAAATRLLLDELARAAPRRILELGAGIGLTTDQMLRRGWQVVSVEPSPVLRKILSQRLPAQRVVASLNEIDDIAVGDVAAAAEASEAAEAAEASEASGDRFDAVIGEGVLYALDLPSVLRELGRLLRPEGRLAFADVVLAEDADPDLVASVHARTKAIFGFPMVPREVLTRKRWETFLHDAGFDPVFSQRVPLVDPGPGERRSWAAKARAAARHPWLLPQLLRFRRYGRRAWLPPGSLEGWAAVWARNRASPLSPDRRGR
jgi:SAM-dependent methyltransferase